jgi:hypothetical protein
MVGLDESRHDDHARAIDRRAVAAKVGANGHNLGSFDPHIGLGVVASGGIHRQHHTAFEHDSLFGLAWGQTTGRPALRSRKEGFRGKSRGCERTKSSTYSSRPQ